ncbi:uncharacterized protein B0H18DRAFT_1118657 [Fomitopsis serialis]|uniref:uncharacterized protein n=1 Tax=Fomitopsis serialis TaxID=139415 RepID=UPI002008BBC0|nr:uncharacterized protein B0H18DRAFT_1118657 [Neoantrodia serialis]KAH9926895.1 hypothetical protein B0H18DRAFT_1118657 [Neoantrodia serialis]
MVYGVYVDWRDRAHSPKKVMTSDMVLVRRGRLLAQCMPLKDFGWYRYDDESYTPLEGELLGNTDLSPEDYSLGEEILDDADSGDESDGGTDSVDDSGYGESGDGDESGEEREEDLGKTTSAMSKTEWFLRRDLTWGLAWMSILPPNERSCKEYLSDAYVP